MCTMDKQFALVGHTCLEAANGLSAKLGHADHALFVVHLMKNIFTYFKARVWLYVFVCM